jgi:hypothetical protein
MHASVNSLPMTLAAVALVAAMTGCRYSGASAESGASMLAKIRAAGSSIARIGNVCGAFSTNASRTARFSLLAHLRFRARPACCR